MRNRETWWFILAVFAASWLLWGGAIQAPNRSVTLALVALGASIPSAAGIALTYLLGGRHERRIFWQRVIDPRRIGLKWGEPEQRQQQRIAKGNIGIVVGVIERRANRWDALASASHLHCVPPQSRTRRA